MGLDVDLQDRGILGAADGGEGAPAALAIALVPRKVVIFDDHRQMAMVAAAWPGSATLRTAPPPRGGVGACRRRGGRGRGRRFGLAAEQLLFAEAELGFEFDDALLELGRAFKGALVHGLPVGGRAVGFKFLGEAWADGTGFR